MAEKEANQAVQKEGKVEQQRKAKADKKSQKKGPPGGKAGGDKRKAAPADHQAWDEDAGVCVCCLFSDHPKWEYQKCSVELEQLTIYLKKHSDAVMLCSRDEKKRLKCLLSGL